MILQSLLCRIVAIDQILSVANGLFMENAHASNKLELLGEFIVILVFFCVATVRSCGLEFEFCGPKIIACFTAGEFKFLLRRI